MSTVARDYVTLVESFRLKGTFEEFEPLVTSLMQRLEREGVASLVSMQFYASDVPNEVGAVIRFSGPSQFTDHVTMISSWPEFARFAAMIELLEIRVFGELSPQVEAWMKQFGGPIKKLDRFVGGFVRSA
jgi:hypothetical protein